jgi:hypothetical protein
MDGIEEISYILGLPSEWLEMPLLLTNVILPFGFGAYAFYLFLNKLRIFGEGGIVNTLLALVLSLLTLRLGQISLFITIPMIAFFGIESWVSRLIFIALIFLLFFYLIPAISVGV